MRTNRGVRWAAPVWDVPLVGVGAVLFAGPDSELPAGMEQKRSPGQHGTESS